LIFIRLNIKKQIKTHAIKSVYGCLLTCCLFNFSNHLNAQNNSFFSNDSSLNKTRLTGVIASKSVLYAGSIIALNELWYKDYPRSSFHFFNDNKEWLQMDKFGHGVASYNISLYSYHLLKWSGVKSNTAAWYSGAVSFAYLGTIELLDGFSTTWGFSWGDVAANTLGSASFVTQELFWNKQRLKLKFSALPSEYAKYRPQVLGSNFSQQLLKDYNAQTYWLSANISSFLNEGNAFPKWLNIAFGYGANGMIGAFNNPISIDEYGNIIQFERYRQYYLSLDIDLSRIQTKNAFLKTLFNSFGFVKFPLPALEINKYGLKGHWIGF
jgi:hypothetical protein